MRRLPICASTAAAATAFLTSNTPGKRCRNLLCLLPHIAFRELCNRLLESSSTLFCQAGGCIARRLGQRLHNIPVGQRNNANCRLNRLNADCCALKGQVGCIHCKRAGQVAGRSDDLVHWLRHSGYCGLRNICQHRRRLIGPCEQWHPQTAG
ncbi:hypothetical protein COO60DRAFT_263292 [Scenedesmus sp. NREL 46B-D3]|nr:hypothetical protein COO60DRAFT_263292 [Scenedesmus sp. NREL 46B-D3]